MFELQVTLGRSRSWAVSILGDLVDQIVKAPKLMEVKETLAQRQDFIVRFARRDVDAPWSLGDRNVLHSVVPLRRVTPLVSLAQATSRMTPGPPRSITGMARQFATTRSVAVTQEA